MASQIAFQDNMVIKIKTERDMPSAYCSENDGRRNLDSPQQNGRLASVDYFQHARQQMIFQDSAQGKDRLLTTVFKQQKKGMTCRNRRTTNVRLLFARSVLQPIHLNRR